MNLRGVAETSLIEVLKNGTQQFLVDRIKAEPVRL